MTSTLTRLFDDRDDAKRAVAALEDLGIPHDDISLLANNSGQDGHDGADAAHPDREGDVSRGVGTGTLVGGGAGLLAGLGMLAIPGLGPVVAAGWLLATATGAGIGAAGGAVTGGVVGALRGAGHSDEDAHVYSEGVRRGGTLVSVRVADDHVSQAEAVFARHNAVDTASRGADFRKSGWTQFDETAPDYTSEEIARDRATYTTARM